MARITLNSVDGKPIHTVEVTPGQRIPEGWVNQSNCKNIAWPDTVTIEHEGETRTIPLVQANKARGQFLRTVARVGNLHFGVNLKKGNVESRPSFLATYTCKDKDAPGKINFSGRSDREVA